MTARSSHRLPCALGAVAAVAAALAVSGCGMLDPYRNAVVEQDRSGSAAPARDGMRLAGQADAALAEIERLRRSYYHDLVSAHMTRNASGTIAVGLTGWALYNATRPDAATVGDGLHRRSAWLAAGIASLFGLRELLVNDDQEKLFAEGNRALACLMIESSPLLMVEAADRSQVRAFERPSAATQVGSALEAGNWTVLDPAVVLPPPARTEPPHEANLDHLRAALDRLEWLIYEVDRRVAVVESAADRLAAGQQPARDAQAPLRARIDETKKALRYARHALNDGRQMAHEVDDAGRRMLQRAAVIVSALNARAQASEHGLSVASLVKAYSDASSQLSSFGHDTAADQQERDHAGGAGSSAAAGDAAGAAALFAGNEERTGAGSWRMQHTAAKAPARPASAAASAPRAPVTIDDLQALRTVIDQRMQQLQQQADRKQREDQLAALRDQQAALDKVLGRLRHDVAEPMRCGRDEPGHCMDMLAQAGEALYAARRPAVQQVLAFRARARLVLDVPACTELMPLRVMPDDVVRAQPGQTVSFLIHQHSDKAPFASVQAASDAKTGAAIDVTAPQGTSLHVARVTIGAEMPPQTVTVLFTDGSGTSTRRVPIVVTSPPQLTAAGTAEKAAKAASDAAKAADGAAKAALEAAQAASAAAARSSASRGPRT